MNFRFNPIFSPDIARLPAPLYMQGVPRQATAGAAGRTVAQRRRRAAHIRRQRHFAQETQLSQGSRHEHPRRTVRHAAHCTAAAALYGRHSHGVRAARRLGRRGWTAFARIAARGLGRLVGSRAGQRCGLPGARARVRRRSPRHRFAVRESRVGRAGRTKSGRIGWRVPTLGVPRSGAPATSFNAQSLVFECILRVFTSSLLLTAFCACSGRCDIFGAFQSLVAVRQWHKRDCNQHSE